MVYKVLITETQRYTAEVEANSPEEATQKAYENSCAGEYDIDGSDDREETYEVIGFEDNKALHPCPECGTETAVIEWVENGYCVGWKYTCVCGYHTELRFPPA